MKYIFNILIFVFLTATVVGQTDSLISGSYEFLEQKNLHYYTDERGNQQVYCDTLVVITLFLDTNHIAYFRNDTVTNPYSHFLPEIKTLNGNWRLENDTLLLHLTEYSINKIFYVDNQVEVKKKLSFPIVQTYSFSMMNEIPVKELRLINEERQWTLYRDYDE
jgi:hypothetical protein